MALMMPQKLGAGVAIKTSQQFTGLTDADLF